MKKEEIIKKVKFIVVIVIVILVVWFLIINPVVKFKSNEKKMLNAGKRYFEVNSSELPTGTRVKTIYLKDLYSKSFLEDDFYVPFTKKACSVTESFIKVKKVEGEYKYYTYLKCGVLSSIGDHKGPTITLNGDDVITIDKGSKYKELGVKSVVDNTDGKIDVSKVEIDSGDVNTKKVGTYKVTYTVFDSLSNKTIKVRTVKVVEKIKNTVKNATNGSMVYTGVDPNNYIYFSNMLFRIVSADDTGVKIVADQDISNVNYNGIDKWLDYFYNHLTDNSKKLIVDNKYCNMNVSDNDTGVLKCSSYTKNKKVYIPSIVDINKSLVDNDSFMRPKTMSWTANKNNDKEAYLTRNIFFGEYSDNNYMKYNVDENYGVRPILTIKGDTLLKGGNGTYDKPYTLGDVKVGATKDLLNTRYTGEYLKYSGYLFRIIDVSKDGTTKVISDDNIKDNGESITTYYENDNIYNPNEKGNLGYYIKNKVGEFIDLDYFVKKEISVPIYKDKVTYGGKTSTKKYNVKVSAPNMYEMFSAFVYGQSNKEMQSYWLINSSKNKSIVSAVTDIGVVTNEDGFEYETFGVRLVGYMNKDVTIVRGKGTINNPYIISR